MHNERGRHREITEVYYEAQAALGAMEWNPPQELPQPGSPPEAPPSEPERPGPAPEEVPSVPSEVPPSPPPETRVLSE